MAASPRSTGRRAIRTRTDSFAPRCGAIRSGSTRRIACSTRSGGLVRKGKGGSSASAGMRRSIWARSADLHLPIVPGTDVVLALAMIQQLIVSGRVDQQFVRTHTNGFDAVARAAGDYSLERAAETCGVSAGDIDRLVDAYAAASPA